MRRKFRVVVNGKVYVVEVEEISDNSEREEKKVEKSIVTKSVVPVNVPVKEEKNIENVVNGAVIAPMPGKIVDIRVSSGEKVKKGDILLILEAMKMENEIVAPRDGVVKEIKVDVGKNVDRGEILLVLE